MAGLGGRDEGNVPAEREIVQELGSVEVGAESLLPGWNGEGWRWKGDAETVNVGGAAKMDGGGDPMHITLLVERAGSEGSGMAGAGIRTSGHNLFTFEKLGPELVVGGVQAGGALDVDGDFGKDVCGRKTKR